MNASDQCYRMCVLGRSPVLFVLLLLFAGPNGKHNKVTFIHNFTSNTCQGFKWYAQNLIQLNKTSYSDPIYSLCSELQNLKLFKRRKKNCIWEEQRSLILSLNLRSLALSFVVDEKSIAKHVLQPVNEDNYFNLSLNSRRAVEK